MEKIEYEGRPYVHLTETVSPSGRVCKIPQFSGEPGWVHRLMVPATDGRLRALHIATHWDRVPNAYGGTSSEYYLCPMKLFGVTCERCANRWDVKMRWVFPAVLFNTQPDGNFDGPVPTWTDRVWPLGDANGTFKALKQIQVDPARSSFDILVKVKDAKYQAYNVQLCSDNALDLIPEQRTRLLNIVDLSKHADQLMREILRPRAWRIGPDHQRQDLY